MEKIAELIREIVINTVRETMKPVGIQNGIYQEERGEIALDPQLSVKPVDLESFNREYEIEVVSGTLNGGPVSGKLVIKRPLKDGDQIKVLKEDKTNKYIVLDKI